ncbi:GntR family transcriptional regulator [Serratia marcescens]|uniref:GntR family transcriptional regulator n=1 Tax=Serratia TaxID=613 RepID=UPI0013DCC0C2|nr:GntR family transcriptional regulator [Serratia marcescens]MDX7540026.1 GntR family transcriptional regulator [Serratia marcescens]MEB5609391.1 GntR family transcriptional regulator [Serratia marcescens]HBK4608685.1 GntR family transcriptional regulator [Serratia marcescens]HBK4670835.1 GntR family transcriptional regulator [Serratia marcescens]
MSKEINQRLLEKLLQDLASAGAMPLYLRFNASVRQAIEQGLLSAGDFLPSERLFTEQLGISRITVRKALACLEQDGIIGRSRGYGTFIQPQRPAPKLRYSLADIKGFSREAAQQGRQPDTQWISRERVPASAELAERLQLAVGAPIYQLKRIHFIDRRPMSVAVSYVVAAAIANIDEIGISLYDYFRRNSVEMGSLRSQVSAAMADDDIRQALQLSEPMPLLIVRQTLFDHRKKPVEYSESFCRSDMYEFTSES